MQIHFLSFQNKIFGFFSSEAEISFYILQVSKSKTAGNSRLRLIYEEFLAWATIEIEMEKIARVI